MAPKRRAPKDEEEEAPETFSSAEAKSEIERLDSSIQNLSARTGKKKRGGRGRGAMTAPELSVDVLKQAVEEEKVFEKEKEAKIKILKDIEEHELEVGRRHKRFQELQETKANHSNRPDNFILKVIESEKKSLDSLMKPSKDVISFAEKLTIGGQHGRKRVRKSQFEGLHQVYGPSKEFRR